MEKAEEGCLKKGHGNWVTSCAATVAIKATDYSDSHVCGGAGYKGGTKLWVNGL